MSTYLVRAWGRDLNEVTDLYPPDKWDNDHVACWWFADKGAREAFLELWPYGRSIVRDRVDGGVDRDGEPIEPEKVTVADVSLRLPDGREATFTYEFGYGYPAHSAEFMWREGNYSCDCNKRRFLARHCGIDPQHDEDDAENPCGDTIEITRLVIRKEAR